jgi:hypothetical protein
MMRCALAFLGAAFLAAPAFGADLSYAWKAGSTYRFDAQSDDSFAMEGMGLNTKATFRTHSVFAIRVVKVKADGSASAVLVVESFDVKTPDGRLVAGLEAIPKKALKTSVDIDRKGAFKFKETVYLVVDEGHPTMLVSVRADAAANSVSAGATAGDQEVNLYASFDPKTGQLSAGYSQKTIAPKKKTIAVEQDASKIEVIPEQFLELLRLPEGDLQEGTSTSMTLPQPGMSSGTTITVRVESLTADHARLSTTIAPAAEGGEGSTGAPGMPSFPGMSGMPGGMPSGAPSMGMTLDGTFRSEFQTAEGMLESLGGTLSSDMAMGGMMHVTTRSTLALKRIGK